MEIRFRSGSRRTVNFGRPKSKVRPRLRPTINDKRWRWRLRFIDPKARLERIPKSLGRQAWNTRWGRSASREKWPTRRNHRARRTQKGLALRARATCKVTSPTCWANWRIVRAVWTAICRVRATTRVFHPRHPCRHLWSLTTRPNRGLSSILMGEQRRFELANGGEY